MSSFYSRQKIQTTHVPFQTYFPIATISLLFFIIILVAYSGASNAMFKANKISQPDAFFSALRWSLKIGSAIGCLEGRVDIRKAKEDELKLEPVSLPPKYLDRYIHHVLTGGLKYSTYKPEEIAPRNHEIVVSLEQESQEFIYTAYKSLRIDEHILENNLVSDMATVYLSLCDDFAPAQLQVLTIPYHGMGVASYDKPGFRYLITTGVSDCSAVTLWDKTNRTACMAHFDKKHLSEESLSCMKKLLGSCEPKSLPDIEMSVVGGWTRYIMQDTGFFNTIEKFAKKEDIKITQTFLGNRDQKRPYTVLYDVKEGMAFRVGQSKKPLASMNAELIDWEPTVRNTPPCPPEVAFKTLHGEEVIYPIVYHTSTEYIFSAGLSEISFE